MSDRERNEWELREDGMIEIYYKYLGDDEVILDKQDLLQMLQAIEDKENDYVD